MILAILPEHLPAGVLLVPLQAVTVEARPVEIELYGTDAEVVERARRELRALRRLSNQARHYKDN